MASKKAQQKSAPENMNDFENFEFLDFEVDESFAPAMGDVVGYWDPEKSACVCIPRGVKLFDGNIEDTKPACLLMCEARRDGVVCKRKNLDGEWEYFQAKKGDSIGVWYKPGMRGILNRAGVECYLKLTDKTQDTGKPNEMKLFDVKASLIGERIPVLEDTRVESAHAKTPFTRGGTKAPTGHDNPDAEDLPGEFS